MSVYESLLRDHGHAEDRLVQFRYRAGRLVFLLLLLSSTVRLSLFSLFVSKTLNSHYLQPPLQMMTASLLSASLLCLPFATILPPSPLSGGWRHCIRQSVQPPTAGWPWGCSRCGIMPSLCWTRTAWALWQSSTGTTAWWQSSSTLLGRSLSSLFLFLFSLSVSLFAVSVSLFAVSN